MTSRALRIYTAVIALICGAAVTWSIHQGSIASAWQADARSWHTLAAQAVVHDRPPTHDGRWGRATMEVCLGLLQSARERREVFLSHQVPARD